MPFIDRVMPDVGSAFDTPQGFAVTPGQDEVDHGSDTPSFGTALGAAFRHDNTVGAFLTANRAGGEDDPTFNPWEGIKGTKYEPEFKRFADVRNAQQLDARKRQLDLETEDQRTLESAEWYKSVPAQLVAGTIDWPTLLPGGAFVRGAKGGYSVARTAASVGTAAALSTTAQEAALHSIQETRTGAESLVNVGASVLVGGLLGAGGAKLLSGPEWGASVAAMERALEPVDPMQVPTFASAGAAANTATSIADNSIAGSAASTVASATQNLNPLLRALHNPSPVYRDIFLNLAENPTYLNKNMEGVASDVSVETFMKTWNAGLADAIKAADETYLDYRKAGGAFTREQFNEAVGRAMRRNDEDADPHVARAAKDRRAKLFDPLKEAAINERLLPPDVTVDTAPSYFSRMWNRQRLIAKEGEFKGIVTNWVNDNFPKWEAGFDKQTERLVDPLRREIDELEMGKLRRAEEARQRDQGNVLPGDDVNALAPGERIDGAAIKIGDRIYRGGTHSEALDRASAEVNISPDEFLRQLEGQDNVGLDGFVTTDGRFLTREQAYAAQDVIDRRARGEMSESDIRQAMRIVQGGAPKPKGVDTLAQFVAREGGLVDMSGELAHRGISNKARPGFVRKTARTAQNAGGWHLDDMARHAWEKGYFPEWGTERPSIDAFLNALQDDFFKVRAVVPAGQEDAFRLYNLVQQLDADLARAGVNPTQGARFSTSEEMQDMVSRIYKTLDAETDQKLQVLRSKLAEREAAQRVEKEARFLGDPRELAREIADEVFNSLTGKTSEGPRPEFITVKARGPLKERTFNIPDELVEDFLESDVDVVSRRYARIMAADVEIARKFGSVDMKEQINKVREDFAALRAGAKTEAEKKALDKAEESAIGKNGDLQAVRDMLRGIDPGAPAEGNYARIVRSANHINYLRSMGEVAFASLVETVRPAMVHGMRSYMQTVGQLATNLDGIKMSVKEAQMAGNVLERVLGHRLASLAEITDPYASRGPIEAFLENMTNFASKWNGIRLLTDMQKSLASVMTQNRILDGVGRYGGIAAKEKAYLAHLGIDESMAGRIAQQFAEYGSTVEKVRVANTERWTDEFARRIYRAAINSDVDSIITTKGVADVPLFASTPTGKAVMQFKTFALASHQRVLLRGLQEDHARFASGLIAMTAIGMFVTWLKAMSGNRAEKLQDISKNPGWWIGEGLDKAGVFSVPMEVANTIERASSFNPIKSPVKAFDQGSAISQKNQNRSDIGSLLGPTVGLAGDVLTTASLPKRVASGENVTQAQKNAVERLLPFNSYFGVRQILRYFVNPQTAQ
jgi:hypothetical protein